MNAIFTLCELRPSAGEEGSEVPLAGLSTWGESVPDEWITGLISDICKYDYMS